jgi:hypothetical protein
MLNFEKMKQLPEAATFTQAEAGLRAGWGDKTTMEGPPLISSASRNFCACNSGRIGIAPSTYASAENACAQVSKYPIAVDSPK